MTSLNSFKIDRAYRKYCRARARMEFIAVTHKRNRSQRVFNRWMSVMTKQSKIIHKLDPTFFKHLYNYG